MALIVSHMLVVGLTLLMIVALAGGLTAVHGVHREALAEGLAAEICSKVKLAAENLWNDNVYRSAGTIGAVHLSLPPRIGNSGYFLSLIDKTLTVQGDKTAAVCRLSVGTVGSGRAAGGEIKLIWTYDGADKLELAAG